MCSTRSLTMWPSCSPCTFRCMLAYKIWLFPAVVMAGSAICQMPSKAAEPPEELVGRRFVAPSHGFTSKPPLDASLPYGEGYTAADSDGRRYVTMMRLRGTRPLANDASVAYRLTYHNLPAGAVVPIGDRLWQVFEAAPGGVARVRPGYDWESTINKPERPLPDLPDPPGDRFMVPHGGGSEILDGHIRLSKMSQPVRDVEGVSAPEPVATIWAMPPEQNGEYLPGDIREVRTGDQFTYSDSPRIVLTVTRIVPSNPKMKLIGWIELTNNPVDAAGGIGQKP